MTPKLANDFLSRSDGSWSVLYPILKEELAAHHYADQDLPFPYEFLFFEEDYIRYYLDIVNRNIPCNTVLDIGCQNGIQSYVFEDLTYIGVDYIRHKWFRDKGNYLCGDFLQMDIELSDKIVISNMSLGYFSDMEDEITNEQIAEKLSACRWLYAGVPPQLLELLKPRFDVCDYLVEGGFPRVFLGKESKR